MVWETVTSSTLRSSAPLQSLTPILLCPQPHRGDNPPGLRCASATVSASNPQHNIIYRDCVTGRWGPFPTACFRSAHNLDYVKRLPLKRERGSSSLSALSESQPPEKAVLVWPHPGPGASSDRWAAAPSALSSRKEVCERQSLYQRHSRGPLRHLPQQRHHKYHRLCSARGAAVSMHFVRVALVACSSCKNLLRYRSGLKAPGFHKKSIPLHSKVRLRLDLITARFILYSQVSLNCRS